MALAWPIRASQVHTHVVKKSREYANQLSCQTRQMFRHGYILGKNDETRLAWSCAVNSHISLAYATREDDPTPLVADVFQAHKRIGYDKKHDKYMQSRLYPMT